MSDSLVEQVRKCAERQQRNIDAGLKPPNQWGLAVYANNVLGDFDFPALLAHMQAQQAVVDALCADLARKDAALKKAIPFIGYGAYVPDIVKMAEDALQPKEQSNGK